MAQVRDKSIKPPNFSSFLSRSAAGVRLRLMIETLTSDILQASFDMITNAISANEPGAIKKTESPSLLRGLATSVSSWPHKHWNNRHAPVHIAEGVCTDLLEQASQVSYSRRSGYRCDFMGREMLGNGSEYFERRREI
jgi:hypothetical protein